MKPEKPKAERMWAVYASDGLLLWPTLSPHRRKTLRLLRTLAAFTQDKWKALYRLGYRCRRVRVVPEERK